MNKNTVIKGVAGLLVLVVVAYFVNAVLFSSTGVAVVQPISPAVGASVSGQDVVLSWGKFNYAPEEIHVKKGVPVTIRGDMNRLQGCFRSLRIPELSVQTTFTSSNPSVTFTPEKSGTFGFSCSMGMGSGKIIVE